MHTMDTAPRDGTHILAYLYSEPDSDGQGEHGEWREIWWKPRTFMGMSMPWHAGDDFDSDEPGCGDSHYGEQVPIAWMPLPRRPDLRKAA